MEDKEKTPFELGKEAGVRGDAPSACPFAFGSEAGHEWEGGRRAMSLHLRGTEE